MIVLDVVEQCGRGRFRIARQEHGRAGNGHRCMLALALDRLDEACKRNVDVARLGVQDFGSAPPGPHDDDEGGGDQHRHVTAVVDLQHVGAEEDELKPKQRQQQRRRPEPGPIPARAQELERKHRRHHHRAGDRDAVGGGERFRRAEDEDERHDAEHQQRVDVRKIDLTRMRLRRVEDRHARQEAQVDRLTRQRKGPCYHCLAGNNGRRRRQDDDR
ncbi:hypothetical protein D9M70_399750 [compost metagenome]